MVAAPGFCPLPKVSFVSESDGYHLAEAYEDCALSKGTPQLCACFLPRLRSEALCPPLASQDGGCSRTGVSTDVTAADFALTGTREGREQLLPGRMQQDQPHASLHCQDQDSSRAQQPLLGHKDTSVAAASTTWEQSVSS